MLRYVAALSLVLACQPSLAATVEETLKQSRTLSAEKKHAEALTLLQSAEKEYPDEVEITLAIARTFSWQGKYDAAEKKLSTLDKKHEENADVQLLRATLAYYRKDYTISKKLYRNILAKHPDYTDAKAGLSRIEKIETAAKEKPITPPSTPHEVKPAKADPKRLWQMDAGFEHSSFSRRDQANWNQEFVQLNRFLNDGHTVVHSKLTRYDQFTNIDTEYELGVDHSFTPYANGYAYAAVSPGADFRPKRRAAAGGMLRVLNTSDGFIPLWLTVDTRYDVYDAIEVTNINPGIRIEPYDGWAFSTRRISVDASDAKRAYGNDYRLDGTIIDTVRFYAGYANAPETVAAVTVDTKTYFGGVTWDATDETTLRLGYTQDDRENSYIRKVVNASVSQRF